MREIGIRELKQSLSATLRAVGGGEHVRVTNRGKAIADILPAGSSAGRGQMSELIASGRLVPPSRPLPSRAPRRAAAKQSASEAVLAEREAER
jgi:antitoxin (DNA-binding transcriptional repressor) of toxin-antitoxin stability system